MAGNNHSEENSKRDPALIELMDDLNNIAAQYPVGIQEAAGQALKSVEGLDNFPNLGATVKEALNLETGTRICTIVCGYNDQGVMGIVTDNSIEEILELAKRFPGVIEQLGAELAGSDNGITQLLAALARSSGGAS